MDVFAWQPSDMVGVPRRLIKHALDVNNSVSPVAQKRRVLACPKDYYPLSKIDLKIEVVVRHPLKSLLDTYKGYHQVQMSEEDEEKTAFYTDQGTYCYVKMPF
ncbi:hypothetical protein Tco_0197161, partial [Tanacetum coccineum]